MGESTPLGAGPPPGDNVETYLLVAGDPMVMQIAYTNPAISSEPGAYVFVAIKPTALDSDGRITDAEVWPVLCGPPAPPPRPGAPSADDSPPSIDHPFPGMTLDDVGCIPDGKAALLNAAKASRALADAVLILHWVAVWATVRRLGRQCAPILADDGAENRKACSAPVPRGLHCPPGGFFIDPVRPVERAVITHGHGDHARAGHGAVVATAATLDIMRVRYGEDFAGQIRAVAYGETVDRDGVAVSLVPAGHVLGSAQVAVRWKTAWTIVVSGDQARRRDPTCAGFEPVPCDVFVSEATFALPVFRHPPDGEEIAKLTKSVEQFPERTHLVGAYALGKAQRLICLMREAGWDKTIFVHGALEQLNALYEAHGVALGPLSPATSDSGDDLAGEIVIAPPSAIADRWARRFADPVSAFASGWMRVRARARQQGVELPLVISDHADWDELTGTIAELSPGELWITHGREEALARWAALNGIAARPLSIVGYEDEDV